MMEKEIKSAFRFENYIVTKVEFENNLEFEEEEVSISFNIDAEYQMIDENHMVTTLDVVVFDNPEEHNYPFKIHVQLAGFFSMKKGSTDDIENFKPNSVSILFPYVRSLITSFTASSNVTPLILPTINVNSYLKHKK